jgi:SAM-dependent methyltransferase
MGYGTDRDYLLSQQYNDGSRLTARAQLRARFGTNRYGWSRWLFDHLRLPPRSRILELGCGLGWLWRQNMARIPAGWDVTLSDFAQGMLDEARQALRDGPHPSSFAVVDAQAIPYPDSQFDAVIANHMLYHVPDCPKAFAEIRRVLKPGGRLHASTLGVNHLREMWELFPEWKYDGARAFPFNLENGAEQLAPFFPHVALDRYEDTLVVTEAEPLVAYVLSLSPRTSAASAAVRTALIRRVDARIAAQGPLQITSDAGLFEAW